MDLWYRLISIIIIVYLFPPFADPPKLNIFISPASWKERFSAEYTVLECVPQGGRPNYPRERNWDQRNSPPLRFDVNKLFPSSLNSNGNKDSLWRFSWTFSPTYYDPADDLFSSSNNDGTMDAIAKIQSLMNTTQSSHLIKKPSRKDFGDYTCILESPGGVSKATKTVEFACEWIFITSCRYHIQNILIN